MNDSSSSDDELEDLYENAKLLKLEGNIDQAVAEFTNIVEKDTKKSEHGFQQLFKVAKVQNQLVYALVLYDQLLAYARDSSLVPRNKVEKSIGNIVDCLKDGSAPDFMNQILGKTADAFRPSHHQNVAKHERLWFLATKKLVEMLLRTERMTVLELWKLETWLDALHGRLKDESGADRPDKASRLWEVYALRMRLACRHDDHAELELLLGRVLQLTCNVSHPETIAFVRECTAYVQFRKSRYTQSYFVFFDAFNGYEQAGSSERTKCLAYMVLLSVLANTPVAPLTLTTTQTLADEPLVRAASQLVEAYVRGGSRSLLVAYSACEAPFRSDDFVKEVIDVIVLHSLTSKMPSEIWIDVMQELTCDDIESSKTVGRRWRAIADQLTEPSRHFSFVSLEQAEAKDSHLSLNLQLAGGNQLRHEGTLADIAALVNAATRHALIEYFKVNQPLEEEFLQLLSPQFFSDVRLQTVVYHAELREKDGVADGELFKKFFLSFRRTPNLILTEAVTFMSDEFLAECTARRVAKINLRSTERGPSKDAIFDFCFAAGDRGLTRTFTVHQGEFDADFIDQVIRDSAEPSTSDAVLLYWSVRLKSSADEQLLAGIRRHAAMRVPCDASTGSHDVYRWTTTPQRLHIMAIETGGIFRTYVIARGDVDLSSFSKCTCLNAS